MLWSLSIVSCTSLHQIAVLLGVHPLKLEFGYFFLNDRWTELITPQGNREQLGYERSLSLRIPEGGRRIEKLCKTN